MKLLRIIVLCSLLLMAACDVFDRGGDSDPSNATETSSAPGEVSTEEAANNEAATSETAADETEAPSESANITPTPEMPQSTTNDTGTFNIGFPEDWETSTRTGTVLFSNIDPVPDITPERFAAGQFFASVDAIPFDVSGVADGGAAEFLERTAAMSGGEFLQLGEIEELTLGNSPAAQATGTYTVGAARLDVLYIVVVRSDSYGLFTLFAPEGEGAQYLEAAQQTMATFDYTPIPAPTREATEEASGEATAEATEE